MGIFFQIMILISKYTKTISLDGYNMRQFRVIHWQASAGFELSDPYFAELYLKRYDTFMSNINGSAFFHYHHQTDKTNLLFEISIEAGIL